MKTIFVILDGLADEPIKELGYKTSYEYARHKNLDGLALNGMGGYFNAIPEGYQPESMNCILNLLGIPAAYFPQSRAVLELLAHGYDLGTDEVVLRCNLAAAEDNRLTSFNGGSLTCQEMKTAAETAARIDPDINFIHLSGYRNLLVVKKNHFQSLDLASYPPHEYLGSQIEGLLRELGKSSEILRQFIEKSKFVSQRNGERYQYLFYPWGISQSAKLPSFEEIYGIRGAAVCGAEIAKGIALGLGLYVPQLKGLTADVDTDLSLKAETACSLLEEYDFVFVHINGLDEASHRYDIAEKISFIEKIDDEFIGYLAQNLDDKTNILVSADHATSPVSGKHSSADVPFVLKSGYLEDAIEKEPINAGNILRYLLVNR